MAIGLIYCLRNTKTQSVYIGQTKQSLRLRLKSHWQANGSCPHLSRAIRKYGKAAFCVEILFAGEVTAAQLDALEIHCIALLRMASYKLYNIADGGSAGLKGVKLSNYYREKIKKARSIAVYQYSLAGDFIAEWASSKEAGQSLGINSRNIRSCCYKQDRKEVGGFQWSRTKVDKLPEKRAHYHEVHMYSKDGKYIRTFSRLKDCHEMARISDVLACFSGAKKSAGGFMWSRERHDKMTPYARKERKDKKHGKN